MSSLGGGDAHKAKEMPSQKPTTLLHYTSWSSFQGMLQFVLDAKENKERYLCFHASHINAMNDRTEGKLILDYFFTGSGLLNDIQEKMSEVREKAGEPYVISFSHSKQGIEHNIIPMWMMYADGGKGVCLHFDYKLIKDNIPNDVKLMECQYKTIGEIKSIAKVKRDNIKDEFKGNRDITNLLSDLMFDIPLYKEKYWEYESEWRLVTIKNNPKYKVGRLGFVPYQEIRLPLSALTKITIGPCANQEVIENTLNLLKSELDIEEKKLHIGKSKLKIQ